MRFKEQVSSDAIARQRVDVSLITFGEDVQVISDFVPISEMPTPTLTAGGCTEMAQGIQTAIDLVKRRTKLYAQMGTPCHKPWIFMITDGLATSSDQAMVDAAERIRTEENKGSHGRLTFWALGISDYNQEQMSSLTKRVMELRDMDFSGMFDLLSESLITISQSYMGDRDEFIGERPPMPARPITDEEWY